jgi:DNA-binding MarR family transcriptional regulator
MPEAIARGSSHGFVALPAALLRELPQPGGQRRLIAYALIHAHGNGSARGCFAALGTLAREAGLSERTVKRAIAELLERGWIKRELRPGHPG